MVKSATNRVSYTLFHAWILEVRVQPLVYAVSRNAEELISNNIYLSTKIFPTF